MTDSRRGPQRLGIALLVLLALVVAAVWFGSGNASDSPTSPAPADAAVVPDGVQATVDYVHDGDTLFVILDGSKAKVRLIGMDTPEIGENAECYGTEARDVLRTLLPKGTTVTLVSDVEPQDQYGRSLLFVYTADGILVNYELVAQGYAEAVFIGRNRMLEQRFEDAEDAAQRADSGIWGECV